MPKPKRTETVDAETGEIEFAAAAPPESKGALLVAADPATQVPGKTIPEIAAPAPLPRTSFTKLAAAIAAATVDIGDNPVVKAGENKFQNYNYARMQDILGTLTPIMSKHGIVVLQSEVNRGFMDGGNAIYATYDFTILHNSGEVWPHMQRQTGVARTRDSKGGFDDKGLNKCHTAARKYFLMALFQIPTVDEEDADSANGYTRGGGRPVTRAQSNGPAPQSENPAPDDVPQDPGPPAEKQKPHEIPRPKGISAAAWGGKVIAAILECETQDEIDAWLTLNENSLADLETHAPKIHANVQKTIDNRVKWVNQ